jgi:hypothetical protein
MDGTARRETLYRQAVQKNYRPSGILILWRTSNAPRSRLCTDQQMLEPPCTLTVDEWKEKLDSELDAAT